MKESLIITGFAVMIGLLLRIENKLSIEYTESYNEGYRQGMLYAYDNVVICGASPEEEGYNLGRIMGEPHVSSISCGE